MQVIDDEGRIFGKFNLVDVVMGSVLLGIIPISYGAFVLFRTPDPSIQSIEPTQVTVGSPGMLRITGNFLNPSLRVVIGAASAETFLVESQTAAEVRLPDLATGAYDIVLLNDSIELDRLPNALTVEAAPAMTINYDIEPAYWLAEVPGSLRITGERLQPSLLAKFEPNNNGVSIDALAFLFESSTEAEIKVPLLPSVDGGYDLVLYDAEGQVEQARTTEPFIVVPPPTMTIYSFEPEYWLAGEPGSLRITGERLQPSLLAKFEPNNNAIAINALAFLFESSTEAEMKVPLLPYVDGGYDLVLYDAEGEVEQARAAEPFIVVPPPTITSPERCQGAPCIGGARALQGVTAYLDIEGENLEPYMRAHFEPYLSVPNSVVYESPEPIITYNANPSALTASKARIRLPELDPATYTLVLVRPVEARVSEYAGSGPAEGPRELARVQGLLTVLPQPEPDPVTETVRITVRFVSRSDVQLGVSVGDQDTSVFASGDSTDYLPSFPVDDFDTERITEFLDQAPEEMHQRVLQVLEDFGVLSGLVAGRGASAQQAAQASWATALAGDKKEQMRIIRILNLEDQRVLELPVAEVQSVGPRRTMPGVATVGLPLDSPGGPSYITDQIVEVFDAVIDVPVTLTRLGWAYGGQHVKVGAVFQMETLGYAAQGWVLNMEFLSQADQRP